MQKLVVTPNLHFSGNCLEAIELYHKVFHAEILTLDKYADADPLDFVAKENQSALVYHAEIKVGQTRLVLSEYDKSIPHQRGNTVSRVITFEAAEEVKKVSDLVSDGAVILSPMSSAANCLVCVGS